MENKKIITASYVDKTHMHKLLNQYLHPIENTDKFRYEDGWDDEKIAKAVDPRFSAHHAQRIRMEVFGAIKRKIDYTKNLTRSSLTEKIISLENQIRRLIEYCGCNAQERAEILGNAETNGPEKEVQLQQRRSPYASIMVGKGNGDVAMQTYWDTEKSGGLPGYLGHNYPEEFIIANGDDCVVRVDIARGCISLFDKPGPDGMAFAAQAFPWDKALRPAIHDMIELHADDWG